MRRPGNLGNTTYWFGDNNPRPPRSFIEQKLQEITLANNHNKTPLSPMQRLQRIKDHLKNPRQAMQGK